VRLLASSIVLLGLLAGAPASAQVVPGPQGASGGLFGGRRPIDPNRASQRLWANIDFSSGYDSNAEGAAGVAPGELVPRFASTADAVVRYWRGKAERFVEGSWRSFLNYESTARDQLVGGEAIVTGSTSLFSGVQLTGGALLTLDPTLLAAQFAPGFGEQEPSLSPSRTNPQGLVQQRWLSRSGYMTLTQTWSPRQSTNFEGRALHRRPFEGDGLVNRSREFSVRHAWNFHPNVGVRVNYRADHNLQTSQTVNLPPLRTSTLDAGIHFERRVSPVRTFSVDVNGGATVAARATSDGASTNEHVLPVASATIRMGLTRVWSMMLEGNREISVLEGVTSESFETNSGTLRLDAMMSRHVIFGVSGVYSAGKGMETGSGGFETASFRSQMQYGFGACCGVFTSYSFYMHHLRDISRLPPGFPERYNGHSVRLGFTWWLPLYGTF
jgi:hypothetical protein